VLEDGHNRARLVDGRDESPAAAARAGKLDAKRDSGHAADYVEAMWLMLQQDEPDDFVVGTGETHSVREFLELAFSHAGLDWHQHVKTDERYLRPAEVDHLLSDPSKAKAKLGWVPKVTFPELVTLAPDLRERSGVHSAVARCLPMVERRLWAVVTRLPAVERAPGRSSRMAGPSRRSSRLLRVRSDIARGSPRLPRRWSSR
jgi:hypothetical protein